MPYPSAGFGYTGDYAQGAFICTYGPAFSPSGSRAEHGELMSDDVVITDILTILAYLSDHAGAITTTCSLRPPNGFGGAFSTPPTNHANAPMAVTEKAMILTVLGEPSVTMQDAAGRWTGLTSDGVITNTIPNASVELIANGIRFIVPGGTAYTVTLTSTSSIKPQLTITEYQSDSAGAQLAANSRAIFLETPVNNHWTAQLSLDPAESMLNLGLRIRDANGALAATLSPDSVLDPNGLADATAPVTQIAAQGARDALGFYRGSVTVTLTASDGGTGVAKSYYSLDGGLNWQPYAGPVIVTAESVPVFLASSLDHNNNAEYPAASLRLQPYRVFLSNLGR